MPGTHSDSDQRLALILETHQAIAAAGDDLESVTQIVADRSLAIIGGDPAIVNLVERDILHTPAAARRWCAAPAALSPARSRATRSRPGVPCSSRTRAPTIASIRRCAARWATPR